jgi:hypothetical protein
MGSSICYNQNIKIFNKFVPPYMAYSQYMIKFSYGWSWRRLQKWKQWKDLKNHWCHYYYHHL